MRRIYLYGKVPFDSVSRVVLIRQVVKWAAKKQKKLVVNMNAYGVVTYIKNGKYSKIMNTADLIYPDGWGPVFASWFFKDKLKTRANVGDFIDGLLSSLAKNKLRLYLLGAHKYEVAKTADTIKKEYKNLVVCGYCDGYFSKKQIKNVVFDIKKAKPNLVLVGMGLPIQEYFIHENWDHLPGAVYMGVGGVFYYISKTKKRAPLWMRDIGFEWLYRFFQEPRRLGRRYTITNIEFLYYFVKALINTNLGKLKVSFFD